MADDALYGVLIDVGALRHGDERFAAVVRVMTWIKGKAIDDDFELTGMDAKLFLIVFICIAALGLVLGIAIGFNLSEGQRCVGDLVIAPGDEDADHYMFLDLAKSPETLAGKERVMLNIKMIRTRK